MFGSTDLVMLVDRDEEPVGESQSERQHWHLARCDVATDRGHVGRTELCLDVSAAHAPVLKLPLTSLKALQSYGIVLFREEIRPQVHQNLESKLLITIVEYSGKRRVGQSIVGKRRICTVGPWPVYSCSGY